MFQFGPITNPLTEMGSSYGNIDAENGLVMFLSNLIKFINIAGGLFAFVNIVLAGLQYISSQGNPEQTDAAWKKIYMSLIGLVIMVSANALAAILGKILFGSWDAILKPSFYGPGSY